MDYIYGRYSNKKVVTDCYMTTVQIGSKAHKELVVIL